jgi:CxxC-x17-CxxC domain-containing protein
MVLVIPDRICQHTNPIAIAFGQSAATRIIRLAGAGGVVLRTGGADAGGMSMDRDPLPPICSENAARCVDCGVVFVPTPDEVVAWRGRGLPRPECCPECRERRRTERNTRRIEALRSGSPGLRAPTAPGPDGGAVRLYPARCADCGRDIRVPFAPLPDRLVYCQDCLNLRRGR